MVLEEAACKVIEASCATSVDHSKDLVGEAWGASQSKLVKDRGAGTYNAEKEH